MKNLLYIGNKLSNKNKTVTTIETLGCNLELLDYKVTYASSYRNMVFRFFDMIISLIKNRKKTDYVLIDTYSTLNFYYAYVISQLCRLFKLKYIPILHGGNLPNRLKNSPKLSQSIFKYAYKNIAPSNYTKISFEAMGYKNIQVIPNTIEIEKYPLIEKQYKSINLLWVRSFSALYNPKLAVSILKILKENGYNASLCMVGPDNDGSLQETKLFAKSLNVEVKFTGKLTKGEWIELSKKYNYFINTTNFDNMPVSVIEAMTLGFPIVSTNVGGLPYLIDQNCNGLLISPNLDNEFALAIIELHNNKSKRDLLIENARKKSESFDWQSVKSLWLNLLK
ncbi:glycosyltransferase family 4 protein [Aurantibacter sp.]|uniref:glycosyltransferase family 4 protein n=1 Tax=Aurantibacter sp. TaxID=2807103 RepID=UPI0035C815D3